MLRPIEHKDLDWIRKERNRPECRDYFRQPEFLTQRQQEEWFNTTDMRSYVILEDHQKRGIVSLSNIDYTARKCEFSIMITPENRNLGFGKKALWELLGHAFNDLNMKQVYSDVFVDNPALKAYEKWGFVLHGILPNWYYKNGKYVDSIVIAITKDDYINSLK